MDFANRPQTLVTAGFSDFGRGTLLRAAGNVTTGGGERYYGRRVALLRGLWPADFPFPFGVFAYRPAHGGKLS